MLLLKKFLAFLVSLILLNQIISFGFSLDFYYYGIIGVAFLILLTINFRVIVNPYMVWIAAAAVLSILFNDIPSFFQAELRLIAFLIVIGLIGPLLTNKALQSFRIDVFKYVNGLLVISLIISAIGIVLGSSLMLGRGGWAGLFGHSMLLGPFAMIALILIVHRAMKSSNVIYQWVWVGLAVLAFIAGIAAGSRSALAAGIAGLLFYYYKMNQGKLSKFISSVMAALAFIAITFPIWGDYTGLLIHKMEYGEEHGDYLLTRSTMWEIRMNEFLSSPIAGLGFAAVDTEISTKFDTESGRVEPGTSWLVILSMTGILGFIPLVLLCYRNYRFLLDKENQQPITALLGALLTFFMVHMLAEGYVFSAGSGLFFYFWLVMGLIETYKLNSQP